MSEEPASVDSEEILNCLWTLGLDSLFWRPVRTGVPSGWYGHIPFAHWIIGALRPRMLVELGTHNGVSYSAFCEAVVRFGLDARCYAVDTWQGDHQAGFYDEDVYLDFLRFHEQHYNAFSELLRCTFDEATQQIGDGSIDLLHIDGLHTYEAVRHDYETWQPKLSDRAVVLFHDTNVRNDDFGVWRLWENLRLQFPSFEFLHGHGLGLLAVGNHTAPQVNALCSLKDSLKIAAIRERFSFLGDLLAKREDLQTRDITRDHDIQQLTQHTQALDREVAARDRHIQQLTQHTQALNRQVRARDARIQSLENETAAQAARVESLSTSLAAANEKSLALLDQLSNQVEGVRRQLAFPWFERAMGHAFETLHQTGDRFTGGGTRAASMRILKAALRKYVAFAQQHPKLAVVPRAMLKPLPRLTRTLYHIAVTPAPANVKKTIAAGERDGELPCQEGEAPSPEVSLPSSMNSTHELSKLNVVQNLSRELAVFLTSGDRLSFPVEESPEVSVIILLFNQAHFTLQCLRALLAQAGARFELILVDNCSTDRTEELLERLENVHILRNRENAGFVPGVNQGAAKATGRTILLLNSDAFIRKDALKIAVQTLESDDNIGAVGGRLILPSGKLQEAGSIVWSDASTQGYGRNLPPDAGEAMFRRDVDYCSAAFLLTPRVLFERLGGLDPIYAPAYYEDADYCLRLWQAGFRVVYEPSAIIDHYEYGSETSEGGATALVKGNRKRFRLQHAGTLPIQHLPPSEMNVLFARSRIDARPRLLVIENEVPLTVLGSGYPRMRALLNEAVAAGWFVTLYPLYVLNVNWDATYTELSKDIEICSGRGVSGLAKFLEERMGYYNAILISRPANMARFKEEVNKQPDVIAGSRLVYDAEAIFASRDILQAELEGRPLSAAAANELITQEIKLTAGVDAVVTVSQSEAQLLREQQSAPVYVLSHPTRTKQDAPGWETRTGFLFVGRLLEKCAPNYDGLTWFLRVVWPAIRAVLNEVDLLVVGALHPEPTELKSAGVQLLGQIEDLRPLYDRARVFVSPIRFAAGVPIKILEASAAGLPVVSTKLMAKQLGWQPGVEIEATDIPAEMAKRAITLYDDGVLWERMRTAALNRLAREHSETVFRVALRMLLEGVDPSQLAQSTDSASGYAAMEQCQAND